MVSVQSSIHSAISIVNAIATGKGATLGISKKIDITIKELPGKGIVIESDGETISSRLINEVIKQIINIEVNKSSVAAIVDDVAKRKMVKYI